jgi:solute carrier family 35, member E1
MSPVSFAVANTIKRIVIIFASMWIFRTPMTMRGFLGSGVAIGGTLLYSLAQQMKPSNRTLAT